MITATVLFTGCLLVIECGAVAYGSVIYNDAVEYKKEIVETSAIVQPKRVVIDAGHGGRDGGVTSSNGLRESDVVLKIAEYLEFELECRGFEVTQTRSTDEGLYDEDMDNRKRDDMNKRRKVIDIVQPDLVMSIHLNNFMRDRSVHGLQCFYQKGRDNGKEYAIQIQNHLNKSGLLERERTAMPADYFILESEFPSVLIECGFLSNAEEEKKLGTDEYRRELAKHIADAIVGILE